METREEHSGLYYKTRGGESPQGKPKVYFCSAEKDFSLYFEEICADIFRYRPECAIFYKGQDDAGFTEERQEVLAEMQLFVMPVTTELLTKENPALSQEYPFARDRRIPVLPLMQEQGLEDIFNRKCGELQFLDKNAQDATAIPYEEKLKKFLQSVLISDEISQKIRTAFDAYVFLSYRKKDRKYAQELMRTIHRTEDFRDIAIWYDEFLVPGENFNQAIRKALDQCNVFTMLVTPNLVNEPNYVQQNEYPEALQSGKPILPVEAAATDRAELEHQYPDIPPCADRNTLLREMHDRLKTIALKENDSDPLHLFFIGLAYLGGVDVERNSERAEALLTRSANLGLPEACEKLAQMYNTGEGVRRNYETAVLWLEKRAVLLKKRWEDAGTEEIAGRYYHALQELGDAQKDTGMLPQAGETYHTMNLVAKALAAKAPEDPDRLMDVALSCQNMGVIFQSMGKETEALEQYHKAEDILERLYDDPGTAQVRLMLSNLYSILGDISYDAGQSDDAVNYYAQGLTLRDALAKESGTMEARCECAGFYNKMGFMCCAVGRVAESLIWYQKAAEKTEPLVKESTFARFRGVLASAYRGQGWVLEKTERYPDAMRFYQKALEISESLMQETDTIDARRRVTVSCSDMGTICNFMDKCQDALLWHRKAFDSCSALVNKAGILDDRRYLSYCCRTLGALMDDMKDLPQALEWQLKALEMNEAIWKETGMRADRQSLSDSYSRLSDIKASMGDTQEALNWMKKAFELDEATAQEANTVVSRQALSYSVRRVGKLLNTLEKPEEALNWYQKAYEILESLVKETDDIRTRTDFSLCNKEMGEIAESLNRPEEALRYYRNRAEIVEALHKETGTMRYCKKLYYTCLKLGRITREMNEPAQAYPWYQKAAEAAYALAEKSGSDSDRENLGYVYLKLKDVCFDLNKKTQAMEFYRKYLLVAVERDQDRQDSDALAGDYESLGEATKYLEEPEETEQWYRKSLEIIEAAADNTEKGRTRLADAYDHMADAAELLEKYEEAEQWYQKALKIREAIEQEPDAHSRMLSGYCVKLGGLALKRENLQEAERWYRRDLEITEGLAEESGTVQNRIALALSYADLGKVLMKAKQCEQAETLMNKALEIANPLRKESDDYTVVEVIRTCSSALPLLGLMKAFFKGGKHSDGQKESE